ncbi:ectoine/hydroxyectoine ABC transporter substrate-binding protein EhuB [Bradyrhizobium sp. ma5]|uniref:ectoine/hydroxyectoine ABC transporter substrate-binding protein EhuB n=1 Tax=Bradyrhizobium sp. ma5 TaxID=3344828 RepID=UPI0035D3DBAA
MLSFIEKKLATMPLSRVLIWAAMSVGLSVAISQGAHAEPIKDRVLREGRITIGILNQAPWAYTTTKGDLAGAGPDMIRAVLEPAGVKKVDFVIMEFGALIPSLLSGRIDVIGVDLSITPTRCEQVVFSEPTIAIKDALLVKAGNPDNIHSFADIAANPKIRLVVGRGSTSGDNAVKAGVPKSQLLLLPGEQESQLAAVYGGRADAISASKTTLSAWLEDPKVKGVELATPFTGYVEKGRESALYTAIAFRPEDTALRDVYDESLKKLKADGTADKILAKYNFTELAPKDVTTRELCGDKYR